MPEADPPKAERGQGEGEIHRCRRDFRQPVSIYLRKWLPAWHVGGKVTSGDGEELQQDHGLQGYVDVRKCPPKNLDDFEKGALN
jgi:hypothetical protein